MKSCQTPCISRPSWGNMIRFLLLIFCLLGSWSAKATAPRITPQLFGEEKKADIVGYQLSASRTDNDLALEIVQEAFREAGRTPTMDVLPSKQVAKYALFNNDAAALIGNQQDLTAEERSQYRAVTFYLRGAQGGEEPVCLFFGKRNGGQWQRAFDEGLQKMVKSGKYLEILGKHQKVPADYLKRLKQHNPHWK